MSDETNPEPLVQGSLFLSFAQACVNLNLLVKPSISAFLCSVEPSGWYPLSKFVSVLDATTRPFAEAAPVIEQIGIEMMNAWYHAGPGKAIITSGVGFLRFQASSEGYHSVIKGPLEQVGAFSLISLDEAAGTAQVHSTTVFDAFDRAMERGVLLGGMRLMGDLVYLDISNQEDPDRFQIRFVQRGTRVAPAPIGKILHDPELAPVLASGQPGEQPEPWGQGLPSWQLVWQLAWRLEDVELRHRRQHGFWSATNDALVKTLDELREARQHLARALHGDRSGRLSGTIITGDYEVGELLGRGGMSEVYHGCQRGSGKEVAIKVLHPFFTGSADILSRFVREANVAAQVASRYVPEIYGMGVTDDGEHFILMERLRGEDLSQVLARRTRLPLWEAVDLLIDIGEALDAVHDSGIIHRDLKPSNIFISIDTENQPSVRLLDFGVSKLHDQLATLTGSMAVIGSMGFIAPEAAKGARGVAHTADIFALGAIAYQAITGELPFRNTELVGFLFEVLHEQPRPAATLVHDLPADVDAVLAIALAKMPEQRYQSARELARDLEAAAHGRLPDETRKRAAEVHAASELTTPGFRSPR